jgi:nucleoside-diphosphate-sugar epimerase
MTDATILSKQWVGYLSSTGVYGDCQGSWVAESQPVAPFSEKAKARVNAEGQWINEYVRYGLPVHIFRLAGIYGPERSALDVLREASGDMSKCKPDDQSLVSRIHVDDIVQVLTSSMSRPTPGLIVNVADDRPATR